MKKIFKALAGLAAAGLLFGSLLTSCSSDDDGNDITFIPVTVSANPTTIEVDGTTKVSANVDSPNFFSSNITVATVDSDGIVKGISVGTAEIKSNKGLLYVDSSVKITVVAKTVLKVAVDGTDVVITKTGQLPTDYKAKVGTADEVDATGISNVYSFTSGEDTYVLTVAEDGTVTATKNESSVAVKQRKTITISGDTSVAEGSSVQLTASEEGVDWTSSDTEIATVSNGLVTGVAAGSATITASKNDDDNYSYASGTYTITVTAKKEDTKTSFETIIWKFSDYSSQLGAAEGNSVALGKEETCGIAVLGSGVKITSTGGGAKGTITEGVAGYCQLSAGEKGAMKITVPAGAKKIVLGAKIQSGRTLDLAPAPASDPFNSFTSESDEYADYTYEWNSALTAETVIYVNARNKSVNLKAFKITGAESATPAQEPGTPTSSTTTGLENTYYSYTAEETLASGTVKAIDMIYLNFTDSKNGTLFYDEDLLSTTEEPKYCDGVAFTYTVDGTTVTITYTEDGKTETETGTLSSDKSTITFNEIDEETKESTEEIFKKVSSAPKAPRIEFTPVVEPDEPTEDNPVASEYIWLPTEEITAKTTEVKEIKDTTGAKSLLFGPGLKIDGRYNLGGSLQTKKNYIKIEVPESGAKVVIHFYNNGSSAGGRKLQWHTVTSTAADGVALTFGEEDAFSGEKETVASSKDDIVETLELTSGIWAIGATNGVYITQISVTE